MTMHMKKPKLKQKLKNLLGYKTQIDFQVLCFSCMGSGKIHSLESGSSKCFSCGGRGTHDDKGAYIKYKLDKFVND